jgi:predicted TIM-barrel fold metal-dependent hydrolase
MNITRILPNALVVGLMVCRLGAAPSKADTAPAITDSHMHMRTATADVEELFAKIQSLTEAGPVKAVNIACIPPWDDQALDQNALAILFKARHPRTTFAFGGLSYNFPGRANEQLDYAEQARRLLAMGFDGIKMIEGKPSMRKMTHLPLSAPAYDRFYALLQRRQVPLLLHVGDPEGFWDKAYVEKWSIPREWTYIDGTFPARETLYAELEDVLRRFPRLKITLAHFGFLSADPEKAAQFLERHPSVALDVTPGTEMYDNFALQPQAWRSFFTRYQDRILFGTDNGYDAGGSLDEFSQRAAQHVACIRLFLETGDSFSAWGRQDLHGLHLDPEVLVKIYAGNFRRRVSAAPKAVDRRNARAYCDWLWQQYRMSNSDTAVPDTVKARLEYVRRGLEALR